MYTTTNYNNQAKVKASTENMLMVSLISASLIFPLITHTLGLKGTLYLPIFFSISLAVSFMSFPKLLALSVLAPTLNMLLTGMPKIPIYYFLLVECVALSVFIFLGRKLNVNFYITALVSMILARFSSIILLPFFNTMTTEAWFNGIVNGYRGIIINVLFAALFYIALKKQSR